MITIILLYCHLKSLWSNFCELEENYISLTAPKKKIIIKGNELSLNKILEQELLIIGKFKSIEVIDE